MAYIHSQGIVHRDIKPLNIFIEDLFLFDSIERNDNNDHDEPLKYNKKSSRHREEEEEEERVKVVLGDFGHCKNLASTRLQSRAVGTLKFVAPELIEYKQYNDKCDIFSLGCVLFALMLGGKMIDIVAETGKLVRFFCCAHVSMI